MDESMRTYTLALLLLIALLAAFSIFYQTALVFLVLVLIFGLPVWFILQSGVRARISQEPTAP